MNLRWKLFISFLMISFLPLAVAGQVKIVAVEMQQHAAEWRANVTLQHADTGWEHYADGWRVVSPDGTILGHRTLYHPHVKEQPFARSLAGIQIPDSVTVVYIEAHDKVHGWSQERVKVDLTTKQGERYRVLRDKQIKP